jgi:WhiB family redox-sensing transcriptional regulator
MDDLPALYVEPQPWMAAARCRNVDPDLFFPTKGGPDVTAHAKAVCAQCPVRTECLEYAVENQERYGVWGGLSPKERRPLMRERRGRSGPWSTTLPSPIDHGTEAGYAKHVNRGQDPCRACREAHAGRERERRKRRLQSA